MYWLLTEKPLYDGVTTLMDLVARIMKSDPVPLQSRRPELPGVLAAVVQRALARRSEDRFPDVTALRQALVPFALLEGPQIV